jgi:hypothetical protein
MKTKYNKTVKITHYSNSLAKGSKLPPNMMDVKSSVGFRRWDNSLFVLIVILFSLNEKTHGFLLTLVIITKRNNKKKDGNFKEQSQKVASKHFTIIMNIHQHGGDHMNIMRYLHQVFNHLQWQGRHKYTLFILVQEAERWSKCNRYRWRYARNKTFYIMLKKSN